MREGDANESQSDNVKDGKGACARATLFRVGPAPKGVNGSRNSAGDPLKVGINTHGYHEERRGALTRYFAAETPDLMESRKFRARIEMIVLVVVVNEPRPT